VFIFVAIPLPMTGVWTGTAIAVFLGLSYKDSILPVCIGNLVAGLLVSLLSLVCSSIGISLDLILWCLLALAVILFAFTIVKMLKSKDKKV
jgi:purine-cytosine permease-like protein